MESERFRALLFPLLFLCSALVVAAQAGNEFNRPWENPQNAIVIDAFHGNSIDFTKLQTDPRIAGILHKATEGTGVVDSKYAQRRVHAKQLGYKWGSYHLLRKGNPISQAKFYLKIVGNRNHDEIIAVDVECTVNSPCDVEKYRVSAFEVKAFIRFIQQKTGRMPVFYGNQTVVSDLSEAYSGDEMLKKLPLWYARFKSRVNDFPNGIWKSYTFWQFSSEINCRKDEKCFYRAPGTLSDMDINVFNGSVAKLKESWSEIGR